MSGESLQSSKWDQHTVRAQFLREDYRGGGAIAGLPLVMSPEQIRVFIAGCLAVEHHLAKERGEIPWWPGTDQHYYELRDYSKHIEANRGLEPKEPKA